MTLGRLLELGVGGAGGGGSGSPRGFRWAVGCGIAPQVQQYLRHSQHCSRWPSTAQEGLVASDWDNPCVRHQKFSPNPQHFTRLWLIQSSGSAGDSTKECFFQRMIVRNSFSPIKTHPRFNFIPVYPFSTRKELSEWLVKRIS